MKNFLRFCFVVVLMELTASCSYASVVGIGGYAPDGRVGEEYRAEFEGYGGSGNYLYNLTQDSILPLGLRFEREDGKYILSGIPREAGEFHFGIEVRALGGGQDVGDFSFKIYGENEELPQPPEPGRWELLITAEKDSASSKEFTLTISGGDKKEDKISIRFGYNATGTVGTSFTHAAPNVYGGKPPYVWNVEDGNIPDGLTLSCGDSTSNPQKGSTIGSYAVLDGIPSEAGEFTFRLKVTDSEGSFAIHEYTIIVQPSDGEHSQDNNNSESVGSGGGGCEVFSGFIFIAMVLHIKRKK